MADNIDIYTRVTQKIIKDLEKGDLTWHKPWSSDHLKGRITKPLRHSGTPYQGINTFLLWNASCESGFTSNIWMTYRQAQELGGQVLKGSKGETVVYANTIKKAEESSEAESEESQPVESFRHFLKTYTVFNTEQIEGLPESFDVKPDPLDMNIRKDERLEDFFSKMGANIHHGGSRAFYSPHWDRVKMPFLETFESTESYYATLAHEIIHWTSHPLRLNRDLGRKRKGDAGYAREELVAELGSAFLCAELGITPEIREDHAAYIEGWLSVLKNDKRAIFQAASHAQKATDFLMNRFSSHHSSTQALCA